MNFFQELRQRRVFRITLSYLVGSWGLLQFLAFLENRMTVSPHLVNLAGLSLLLLLPAVITLAWVHGRPGKDTWGRTPKVVVSANVVAVVLLVGFLFSGRDLGGVTRTIAVEDENGAVTERVVPKSEYRRRVLLFYPENSGPDEDAWASETTALLLSMDLSQDGFLDVALPLTMTGAMLEAGSRDGHGLPRALQRKLARDAHIAYFLTGTIVLQGDGQWQLATELHESESGKVVTSRTDTAADLFALVDHASRQLREDLGIPAAHLDENPDLPIAELSSADIEAVKSHVNGVLAVTHQNDWEGAAPYLEDAVARDPHFTLAQFLLFAVRQTLGDQEGASVAISAAMENLYRVPERLAFMIKSQYYFNEKQDADKAMAVLEMWSQIYPDDVDAYEQQATYYFIRQDLPSAIAAYERILDIDPSRVQFLDDLADLHTQLGNHPEAEACLQRYVEIFPGRADGYEDLSDFYSITGRLDEAREALEKAQLLEPENLDLALSLIDLDVKFGRYAESERALADLMAGADTDRDRIRVCARQMELAGLRGRPDVVIDRLEVFYERLLAIQNPMQANLVYTMALPAISMAGRPDAALSRLAEVKTRIPAPYADLAGVGEAWVLVDLGRLAEARAALAAAVVVVEAYKFETFRSSIALIEGMIAEAEGDLDTAIARYRTAAETAVQVKPMYSVRLARTLRLAGESDEARTVLDAAVKVEPAHPEYQLELAQLAYDKGDLARAQEHLTVALAAWDEADPEFRPARQARELSARIATP